jgi:glycosyltransferase involved in cell wall biosynthesis
LEKAEIAMKYLIPEKFILYVGTVEERKNLLNIVKAIHLRKIDFPLVIVGKLTEYVGIVKAYIESNKIQNVFFLQGVPNEDLPTLYQMAEVFVYPSIFEGFGIPIVEAITSKTPVITTKGGCFAEAGGKSSIYIDPENPNELGEAMHNVLKNSLLRDSMIIDGYIYAQQFRQDKIAQNIMNVYEKVV